MRSPYPFIYAVIAVIFAAGLVRAEAIDALDAANAARAARGLPPFIRDPNLTAGAIQAANFRAARLMAGHTANDFQALPPGTHADAAGCAGNDPSWGFMACALYEPWTYAGAAWAMGSNGKLFCHLFVRGSSQPKGVSYASPTFSRGAAVRGRRR